MRKLSMEELNRMSVGEFKEMPKLPVVVVLDNIRSQHNIGSVFRTADAFRVDKIILCGISATPPNREIQKTALGATESVDWSYEPQVLDAVASLKADGYMIVAVEQTDGSVSPAEFSAVNHKKVALVFGNEINGVSDEVVALADACIEIPQFGTKHSFNVSVTAGIVLYEIFNKLKNV
ncbi:MAG TPA: RNA methyltransferase [Bacteroidales bacterium]|nr:RNA methyltransferase [Bacteroidales bacterium]